MEEGESNTDSVQSDLKSVTYGVSFSIWGRAQRLPTEWLRERETETSAQTQSGRDGELQGVSREPTACCRAERSESELKL